MIIDNKSCANISSTTLVRKWNLNIIKNKRPYRLQLLNDYEDVKVIKQVLISVKKCKDIVLCDIVPTHATHLLLGDLHNLIEKPSMIGLKMIFD